MASRFATLGAPLKPATAPASASPAASASASASASTTAPAAIVTPSSSSPTPASTMPAAAASSQSSNGGSPSRVALAAARSATMLPLSTSTARKAVPASAAPDSAPDAARIYSGLGKQAGARAAFWKAVLNNDPSRASAAASGRALDLSSLDEELTSEVELELEAGNFASFIPPLSAEDLRATQQLLLREALQSERESMGAGHAHMAARLYVACDRDSSRALDLFCALTQRLRPYEHDAPLYTAFRQDCLRLCDALLASGELGRALASHFNALGFDLVDLSDVLLTWTSGLFCAAPFPAEMALRSIDLVLWSGGADQLWPVLLALLLGSVDALLRCNTCESLYAALAELPERLDKNAVDAAFERAYWTLHGPTPPSLPEVEWGATVAALPGPLRFQKTSVMKTQASTHATSELPSYVPPATPSSRAGAGGVSSQSGAATTSPHHRPNSMVFDLRDLSSENGPGSGRKSSMVAQAQQTPLTSSSQARSSISAAASPTANDSTLVSELTAASAAGYSSLNPRQMQSLLERALRQLKTGAGAGAAGHRGSVLSPASGSSNSPPAGQQGDDSHNGVAAPELHVLPALDLSPLDRVAPRRQTPASGLIKYSELLDHQLWPTICMESYLLKARAPSRLFRRKGGSGFFGNLHRRFFRLQGSFLTYFKLHTDPRPTRDESIDLRFCVASRIRNHEYGPFAFQISQREKGAVVLLLFAANEHVRDVWLQCLAHACGLPTLSL